MDTKALRQKVLDLAIRGKLVPQNPNDEPASVLLERIRQQKQQMVKEGKLKAKDIKNDSTIFVGEDNLHYEKFADGSVKCIEDEIPFDLPGGWAWARIATACIVNPRNSLSDDTDVSFIPMPLISEGYANSHTAETRKWKDIKSGFTHFSENDIGIAKITPCFENRKSTVFKSLSNGYGAGTTELHILRTIANTVLPEYLLWIVKTDDFIHGGIQTFSGAVGQQRVGKEFVSQYLVPIPPHEEQVRIVAKLGEIFGIVTSVEQAKGELQSSIKGMKSKILDLAIRGQLVPQNLSDEPASALLERIRAEKEALIQQGKIKRAKKESIIFRGEDNSYYAMIDGVSIDIAEYLGYDLPDGWIWITLKDIATITSGKTPKPDQLSTNGTVPYFKIADMNTPGNELYLRHTDCYINDLYSGPVYDDGSFVFPKNGGAVLTNKKRILTNTSVVDLNTGVFTPSKLLNQDYIFFLFSSIDFSKIHKGAVIPTVDSTVIGNLIYGLPPIEEQKRIANIIKNLFAQVDQIEIALS